MMTQHGSRWRAVFPIGLALLAVAGTRWAAQATRPLATPNRTAAAGVGTGQLGGEQLAQLDASAMALLLGGLRGPLVMALWSNSENQRGSNLGGEELLGGLDAKIELIRLLQPQFDTVHLYQVHNKAYNLSAELTTPAGRYSAVLDALRYAREAGAGRPDDIDLETKVYEVYNQKLASAQEKEYYTSRIRRETQVDQPLVKLTFPADEESKIRLAAREAGVSPRDIIISRGTDPSVRTITVGPAMAEAARRLLGESLVAERRLAQKSPDGPGRPQRLPAMLDEDGNIAAAWSTPTRETPDGLEPGQFLDGSRIQFLQKFGPFPDGLSPHALAYEHAMRAYVLQEFAGQRHLVNSEEYVDANPGRALLNWSITTGEEARQVEAEAFGFAAVERTFDGRKQREAELRTAGVLPTPEAVVSPELLQRAIRHYEMSRRTGAASIAWFDRHLADFPGGLNNFEANMDRLRLQDVLYEADAMFARLALGESVALERIIDLYREADRMTLDFVLKYHVEEELLPPRTPLRAALSYSRAEKERLYRGLQLLRDQGRGRGTFDHERALDEADGIRGRIQQRIEMLEQL